MTWEAVGVVVTALVALAGGMWGLLHRTEARLTEALARVRSDLEVRQDRSDAATQRRFDDYRAASARHLDAQVAVLERGLGDVSRSIERVLSWLDALAQDNRHLSERLVRVEAVTSGQVPSGQVPSDPGRAGQPGQAEE